MMKKEMLVSVLLIAAVVTAGCTATQQQGIQAGPDGTIVKPDGTIVKPDGTMVLPNGTMIAPSSSQESSQTQQPPGQQQSAQYSGTVLAGSSAPLIDFNKADYDAAVQTDKLVVLYFYANWCPICRQEVPHLEAAFNELETDKVIGFRVNYNDDQTDDNERELARQFGVPYQHTKVFLKNGTSVLKSPEGWDKDRYINEINKALG